MKQWLSQRWKLSKAKVQNKVERHRINKIKNCVWGSFCWWHITSRHWSVHEHSPHLLCGDRHLFWHGRVDGGGVDQQCSLLHLPWDDKKHLKRLVGPDPSVGTRAVYFTEEEGVWGWTDVKQSDFDRPVGLLEDATGPHVHFYDIGTGGQHCDDAVCSLRHLRRWAYNLRSGVTVAHHQHKRNTFTDKRNTYFHLVIVWNKLQCAFTTGWQTLVNVYHEGVCPQQTRSISVPNS